MRTLPQIKEHLETLDEVVLTEFIPAITNGIKCSQSLRELMSLPLKMGRLGIPIFAQSADLEFMNSEKITESLVKSIINQQRPYDNSEEKKIINILKKHKNHRNKTTLRNLRETMNATPVKTERSGDGERCFQLADSITSKG